MSRPRKKYRLYSQPVRRSVDAVWTPSGFEPVKTRKAKDTKIMAAVKATIKKWLDSTPAFSTHYFGKHLIVRDAIYSSNLAVIKFEDDYLAINLPVAGDPLPFFVDMQRLDTQVHKVHYSDPQLRQRVKYLVNKAYDRQPST